MSVARIVINGKFLGAGLNGVHRTAAHYSSCLIERARAAGHEVRLVSPRPFGPDPGFPLLQPEVVPGLFGGGQGWEMLTLPCFARGQLLVNFCNLAPVLHGNSVVMIHDAQTFLYPADYSGRQAAAYRVLLPVIARRARRILTVSDFSRRLLVENGIGRAEKIDVVHNGTDHILAVDADDTILEGFGIRRGGFAMVLGSTKHYKNIARVFAAMADEAAPGLTLVVVGGPGREAYVDRGWTPPGDTIFTGFVSDGQLRALYAAAKVFVFSSLTEGFGLPPVEAMHCGTPVIAANAGAIPEVCGEAAILVDPNDTSAWRDAIARVVSEPTLAASLVRRGRERAGQLRWRQSGDRLWQVLAALV